MQDWKSVGPAYAQMMVKTAHKLATEIASRGVDIFAADKGFTKSHQFAILAKPFGGGQTSSKKIAHAGLLSCGIGLPGPTVDGDNNGLRIGTPEVARIGMKEKDMPQLADFIVRALTTTDMAPIAKEVKEFRKQFSGVHYTVDLPE